MSDSTRCRRCADPAPPSLPAFSLRPGASLVDLRRPVVAGRACTSSRAEQGATSLFVRHRRARVGPRRAPPARLPLPLSTLDGRTDVRSQLSDPRPARRPDRRASSPSASPTSSANPPSMPPSHRGGRQSRSRHELQEPAAEDHATEVPRSLQSTVGLLTGTVVAGVTLGGLVGVLSALALGRFGGLSVRAHHDDGRRDRLRQRLPRAVRGLSAQPAGRRSCRDTIGLPHHAVLHLAGHLDHRCGHRCAGRSPAGATLGRLVRRPGRHRSAISSSWPSPSA